MLKTKKKREAEEVEAHLAKLQARTAFRINDLLAKQAPKEFDNLDTIDTRLRQRKETSCAAKAFSDEDHTIDCTIVDMSLDGLKLVFAQEEYLPQTVILDCEGLGGFIVGEVKWQNGTEVGLQLDRKATKSLRLAAAQQQAA